MTAEPVYRPAQMSFEQAAELNPDQFSGELINGEWTPVTRSTHRHGAIVTLLCVRLYNYAEANPGWTVTAGDAGIKLSHNPDTLRGADVAVFRTERMPQGKGVDGWLEGAPEVAIEVIGDSQSFAELGRKALEYLRAGSKMVWVLDPEARALVLFSPAREMQVLGPDETLDGGDVLPGFKCQVSRFFS